MTGIDWIVIEFIFDFNMHRDWSSRKQQCRRIIFFAGRNVGWFAIRFTVCFSYWLLSILSLAGSGATVSMMQHWEMHADYADTGLDFRAILLPSQCLLYYA